MLKSGKVAGYLGVEVMVLPVRPDGHIEYILQFKEKYMDILYNFTDKEREKFVYYMDIAIDTAIETIISQREKGKT